jgi:glucose-6-phosphate isomerase
MKLHLDRDGVIGAGLADQDIALLTTTIEHLKDVVAEGTYHDAEASINLPTDDRLTAEVLEMVAQKKTSSLRYVFVVGIGGSNLGTKAVYDALYGMHDIAAVNRPKLLFVDTVNAILLDALIQDIVPTLEGIEDFLLVTISKSGGTTETLANTEIIMHALTERFGGCLERVVVITDEGSDYWEVAGAKGIARLGIPKQVGGRYSVFSAVGLFPLALIGLDIHSFRHGASEMRAQCLTPELARNPAAQSSLVLLGALRHGKTVNDNFVFHSELESLGKWYRQLMGESIGKERNGAGEVVHAGITPTVSVGSTDLHSVGQLYLGGPRDKITTFIYSADTTVTLSVPAERIFPGIVEMISGTTTTDIMSAIFGGVKVAYRKNNLPFMEVELASITPYELGACMQFKMIEMMFLGALLDVNPFDQPNVESYKVETKQLLEKK